MDIAAAKAALADLDIDDNPAAVRAKSRDFFWYSPVLKDRLDHLSADFAVMPRNQDEVLRVLAVCHAHDVPVTVRGSGTGNYGQAMPLAGGCIMHMQNMAEVLEIGPGRVTTQPGVVIRDLDRITRDHSGQELRMMPSTAGTATIDSLDRLAAGIDDLRARLAIAGREPSSIDIVFNNFEGGNPGADDFNADAYLAGVEKLAALRVTWLHVTLPGDSLAHALEAVERFGTTVIAAA